MWDATTGVQLESQPTQPLTTRGCHAQDRFIMEGHKGLIVDLRDGRILSKVPSLVGVLRTASSETAILLRTTNEALVLHIPSSMLVAASEPLGIEST